MTTDRKDSAAGSVRPSMAASSPPVPKQQGPRAYLVLYVVAAITAAGFVVVCVLAGGLADLGRMVSVRTGEQVTAVVAERAISPGSRSLRIFKVSMVSRCESAQYVVEWDGGRGSFSSCTSRPLSDLRVGDTIRVRTQFASPEVVPEGQSTAGFGLVMLLGAWLAVQSARAARRYRRLATHGAGVAVLEGRISKVGHNVFLVTDGSGDGSQRPWVMLPAKKPALAHGDPVRVWASRRSRFRRRPRGPWVVRAHGTSHVITHAWPKVFWRGR